MRIAILIDKNGNYINPQQELINSSPIDESASITSYATQITLEFYNSIITNPSGLKSPDFTSVVTTGIIGTMTVNIYASKNSPYPVTVSSSGNVINMATSNTCQWTGITDHLTFTTVSPVGFNYILVLFDRNNSGQ